MASDVLEYLIDGTSGIVTGSVGGCIVAGVCSEGQVGRAYILDNRADVVGMLGDGELTIKVKDILAKGGQNPLLYAVPVAATTKGKISPITRTNTDIEITVTGEPKVGKEYVLEIVQGGNLNVGIYKLNDSAERTLPADGFIEIDGLEIELPDDDYPEGAVYTFTTTSPTASITSVMTGLEKPLELYDVEFVYITGASDSVGWAAAQAKAEDLWNLHRPTYFKMEARMPAAGEDINDWAAELVEAKKTFSGRFVQVCAAYGTVTDSSGNSSVRNFAGLQAGRTIEIPVQREHGRVRDGGITSVTLPDEWNGGIQDTLEKAGYITAKTYGGLSGVYWGDNKTMAEVTSDFQREHVLRVTFKGVRLARVAALKSIKDEIGDPTGDMPGIEYLKTNIEVALDTMVKAFPQELAAYNIVIPPGQDFVNNGIAVEMTLIGIPIIDSIKLFANYTYAGSRFDPRLKESA